MQKRWFGWMAALICCVFCIGAGAEVTWTYDVPLVDLKADYIALASSEEPLASTFVPERLEQVTARRDNESGDNTNGGVYVASSTKQQLATPAINALVKLTAAAELQGYKLYVRQGYRSYDEQERRWSQAEKRGETATNQKAGQCDYQTGLALTLVSKDWRTKTLTADYAATAEGAWVVQNCARYGFILRYPEGKEAVTGYAYEPWHLRYVGENVAQYMVRNGLTLEEFRAEADAAVKAFADAGGDMAAEAQEVVLPAGPVVLEACDDTGDHDITLFHD